MNKVEFSFPDRFWKNTLKLLLVNLIIGIFTFGVTKIETENLLSNFVLSPANAQTLNPEKVATEVYQQMPNLPKENQYLRQQTQEVDEDNTLVSRIVRYHQYIKARPTAFRLDWKLTLADYLKVNEEIPDSRYPGYSTLTDNPLPKDREVIDSLTFTQRQQLVDILVSIYNPQSKLNSNSNSPQETNSPQPEKPNNNEFKLPIPGGADLLLP